MGPTGLLNKITSQRTAYGVAAIAAVILMSFISSIVSAEAISEHSITPSTASVGAEEKSVQYTVEFTPETNAAAFVIDFCTTTPLLGQGCIPLPTGLNVSEAATATQDVTVVDTATAMDENTIVATKAMTAGVKETITFTGITNPTEAGVVYARIVTYAASAGAEGYVSENPSAAGEVVDSGSVAMYFDESINVSGTVLETMTFCVSSQTITENCGNVTAPVVTLGQETATGSGIFALTPGVVSEGTLFTQINTNAASGVVVRLKSSAECGGLKRAGTDVCDIEAALNNDVLADNTARFGVKTSTPSTVGTNPTGTLQPYDANPEDELTGVYYTTDRFSFFYDSDNPTTNGVTSTFGDSFLDTAGAPAVGVNMQLTFAASASASTPAGSYSTDLSMIAVGKF